MFFIKVINLKTIKNKWLYVDFETEYIDALERLIGVHLCL